MIQKNIREHNGQIYTVTEAAQWLKELDDRTKSSQEGYNSINELAGIVKKNQALQINNTSILRPVDAIYHITATSSGAIKIALPTGVKSSMMKLYIGIGDFSQNNSFDIVVTGYFRGYNKSWIWTSAQILTSEYNLNYTVRFGYENSKNCIYIGELNSSWSYLQVSVSKAVFSYNDYECLNWLSGWDIGLENTSFRNITQTHVNNLPVAQ